VARSVTVARGREAVSSERTDKRIAELEAQLEALRREVKALKAEGSEKKAEWRNRQ
jgi:predicted RNase H-like nuclease (RuvC/YqgF family)